MLAHLQIRDFAIIDSAELELAGGLTALTGETGAGKSIIVDAVMSQAGSYNLVQGTLLNRTAHLNSIRPAGGNIAFLDGHTSWRNHAQMTNVFGNGAVGQVPRWEF